MRMGSARCHWIAFGKVIQMMFLFDYRCSIVYCGRACYRPAHNICPSVTGSLSSTVTVVLNIGKKKLRECYFPSTRTDSSMCPMLFSVHVILVCNFFAVFFVLCYF